MQPDNLEIDDSRLQKLSLEKIQRRIQHAVGRAIADYERALELNPNLAPAMNSLAWDLATMPTASRRDGPRAVELAERALGSNKQEPGFLDTLAAAYAEAGRFADAVRSQETAIELLLQAGTVPAPVIEDFQSRLQLYQNNRPFHRPE